MLDQTGLARAPRRPGRRRSRAATSSGSTSRSACSRDPSVLLLDEPSAGLDPRQRERLWEFVARPRRRRDDGHLLDPQHRRGRALRRPAARARRRRGALRRQPRRAAPRGRPAARAARPRLRGRFVALPARAGPLMRWLLLKDLQILRRSPLVTGAAGRLPDRARGPDRLRALAAARRSRGSRSSTRSRRAPAVQLGGDGGFDRDGGPRASSARGSSASTSRAAQEAEREGRDGDVLGGLILPAGPARQAASRSPPEPGAARRSRCSSTRRTRSRRSSSTTGSARCSPRRTCCSPSRSRDVAANYLRSCCSTAASFRSRSSARPSTSSACSSAEQILERGRRRSCRRTARDAERSTR